MKITESELKRIIKEEVLNSLKRNIKEGVCELDAEIQPMDNNNDAAALQPVYALVDTMQEIADERVYDQGPEDSPYVHVEVSVEDACDGDYDNIINYHGKTMKVMGEIDFTYKFHSYDDAEISDWEPNIYLMGEDGERVDLNIE